MFVVYVRDSNAIIVEPMKNRSKGGHIRVYIKIYSKLIITGFTL